MYWKALAAQQLGIVARRQLVASGVDADRVRNQVAGGRWAIRTPRVISTFTGTLTWQQRVWVAVLHAGGSALVGGLTACEWHGLTGWHREVVTVLVDDELSLEPEPGVRFFRTRRALADWRAPTRIPLARIEPAALLFSAHERSDRTAVGLLAAVVQQRLTTAERLGRELEGMRPLRRAKLFRTTLADVGGGAQSLAELDLGRWCRRAGLPAPRRQTRRPDRTGATRFTDCEWTLADGRTLVLEIDGAFHMDVTQWELDLARQRQLASRGTVIVRCTARELRDNPEAILNDLEHYGLCA